MCVGACAFVCLCQGVRCVCGSVWVCVVVCDCVLSYMGVCSRVCLRVVVCDGVVSCACVGGNACVWLCVYVFVCVMFVRVCVC